MTPQQKANDLMSEYERITRPLFKLNEYHIEKEYNKQCALIAVDEIIKEYGTYYKIEVNGKYVSYWQQVKEEINKL